MSMQQPPPDPYGPGHQPYAPPPPAQRPVGQRLGLGFGLGVAIGILLPVVLIAAMWGLGTLFEPGVGGTLTGYLFWALAVLPVLMLIVGAVLMASDTLRAYGVALMTAAGVSIITSAGLCVLVIVGVITALSQSQ